VGKRGYRQAGKGKELVGKKGARVVYRQYRFKEKRPECATAAETSKNMGTCCLNEGGEDTLQAETRGTLIMSTGPGKKKDQKKRKRGG